MLINFGAIQSKSVNATIMLHFGSQDNHKVIVKLRQGSGKDGQGMALQAKGLKA